MPEVRVASLKDLAPDDAAIMSIGGGRALLTSVDFQNAIVDDAALAGEIAARNALSDLFACGVQPLYADVMLVVPYGDGAIRIGKELMRGVALACMEDGCAIVGGHTIQGEMPVVGLSVTSIAPLECIKRKSGAQAGDILLLTKPLGTGIAIAARQQAAFSDTDYAGALKVLRTSNRVGALLGEQAGVTAMTDITDSDCWATCPRSRTAAVSPCNCASVMSRCYRAHSTLRATARFPCWLLTTCGPTAAAATSTPPCASMSGCCSAILRRTVVC